MKLIDADLLAANLEEKKQGIRSELISWGLDMAIEEIKRMAPVPDTPTDSETLARALVEAFNLGLKEGGQR